MKLRILRKKCQLEMRRWVINQGPFKRLSDLTRGWRKGHTEIGQIESIRFIQSLSSGTSI